MKLELRATPTTGARSEIMLTAKLTNVSKWDVFVNARMGTGGPVAAEGSREIWLSMENVAGQPLDDVFFACRSAGDFVTDADYRVLRPGESAEMPEAAPLLFCLKNLTPGAYRVRAHYKDDNPNVPKKFPEGTFDVLDLVITSNAVPITLTEDHENP